MGTDLRTVELFHIGPQKAGTTWVYRCLAEHPDVAVPPRDSIHYYDIHFARGAWWYEGHFDGAREAAKRFDPTPTYVRSQLAPRRIAHDNPTARIALTLRDPVERAFSHYWHEKKKGRIDYAFAEVLENYDLFQSWVEPGFYAEHLETWFRHFPKQQILCQRFEDIATTPESYLDELCVHFGIQTGHRPATLRRKVNAAGPRRGPVHAALHRFDRLLQRTGFPSGAAVSGKREYERGIDPDTERALRSVCEPETARLESLLEIDLSSWRGAVVAADPR